MNTKNTHMNHSRGDVKVYNSEAEAGGIIVGTDDWYFIASW
ncbi:hypothetical protein [Sphingobacterium sp. GVS05A]|nr:hypothetical protein [Sphingobacterium sp. GVS05A]